MEMLLTPVLDWLAEIHTPYVSLHGCPVSISTLMFSLVRLIRGDPCHVEVISRVCWVNYTRWAGWYQSRILLQAITVFPPNAELLMV